MSTIKDLISQVKAGIAGAKKAIRSADLNAGLQGLMKIAGSSSDEAEAAEAYAAISAARMGFANAGMRTDCLDNWVFLNTGARWSGKKGCYGVIKEFKPTKKAWYNCTDDGSEDADEKERTAVTRARVEAQANGWATLLEKHLKESGYYDAEGAKLARKVKSALVNAVK